MIIQVDHRTSIDTDKDLSAAERHVLQKLFGWKTMVTSISEFRDKKRSALQLGWNNSGALRETRAMNLVVHYLEKEIRQRLRGVR